MRAQGAVRPARSAPAGTQEPGAGGHNERAAAQVDAAGGQQEEKQKQEQKQEQKEERLTRELKRVSSFNKTRDPRETRHSRPSTDWRQQPAGARMSPPMRHNSTGPQMGAAEAGARSRDRQVEQFTQVPQQFSQTPNSFSGALSHANNLAGSSSLTGAPPAPFFHQTMPADLSVAAPNSQQASGPIAEPPSQFNLAAALEQSATHTQLGNLMAAAAVRQQQQQQQQELMSQFSNLHSLSAVASAIQHQHHQSRSKSQEFPLGAFATSSHLGAVSQQQFQSMGQPAPRKPPGRRRRGARKCRKVYGMAQKPLWCTQCKWKKACSRFAAANAQQADLANTTTDLARRPAGPKTRAPPLDYQMAAAAAAATNGNHLIRNLLDMSASFQRLQAVVTQPSFRSNAQV